MNYEKLFEITKEQIDNLRTKNWNEEIYCSSFLLIPTETKHDSGFNCLNIVAIDENNEPICKCSGYSDVIAFNGIGGYGEFFNYYSQNFPKSEWNIDLLPCGYFRVFSNKKIKIGETLSILGVYNEGYYNE